MSIYTLKCPECGAVQEVDMSPHDKEAPCRACGTTMIRKKHRHWASERIILQPNATGSGGSMNWEPYYDPNIADGGAWVKSKQHRKDLMEKGGLREFTPDPDMQASRNEQRYIQRNASPKEAAEANAAVAELQKTAQRNRARKMAEPTWNKVKEEVRAEVLSE